MKLQLTDGGSLTIDDDRVIAEQELYDLGRMDKHNGEGDMSNVMPAGWSRDAYITGWKEDAQ